MVFHKGFAREVPHQEQTVSSLPIRCLQRGQSVGLFAIDITPPEQKYESSRPGDVNFSNTY